MCLICLLCSISPRILFSTAAIKNSCNTLLSFFYIVPTIYLLSLSRSNSGGRGGAVDQGAKFFGRKIQVKKEKHVIINYKIA